MQQNIINGQAIANEILINFQSQVEELPHPPGLAVILVGDNDASQLYIQRKQAACKKVGIRSYLHHLPLKTTETSLLKLINELNKAKEIHGILVQLPLPEHIEVQRVIEAIDPKKDVDGFHPYNLGRLAQKSPLLRPCTPLGIMEIFKKLNIAVAEKDITIVGTSNIVGRPMGLELLIAGGTVTYCHRKTKKLCEHVQRADIVISATGEANLIKGAWVKSGATVIDVGISRLPSGQLCGDVEFEAAQKKAKWITPVPGGVGPMTVAMLIKNTLQAYRLQKQ